MSEISTESNIVSSSQHDHTITSEQFRENTINRRLKGIVIWDPQGRDEDHPAVRGKDGDS